MSEETSSNIEQVGLFPQEIAQPQAHSVAVPKGLVFPITPSGPITLNAETIDGDRYTLLIGGVGPLSGDTNRLFPSLCLRHLRLILKILFGRPFNSRRVPISYTALLDCDGYRHRQLLRRTLSELSQAYIHKVRGGNTEAFRLLELKTDIEYKEGVDGADPAAIERELNIKARYLREVRFAEDFWRPFLNWANCYMVRADVVNMVTSDIACAGYLLLTPKAYHHQINEKNKGRKDAAEFLREIGATVPKKLSDLRNVFQRSQSKRGSVLAQMDNLPTLDGFLRVELTLEVNASGKGFNLRYWIASRGQAIRTVEDEARARGSLLDIWLKAGMSREDFDKYQNAEFKALEPYEEERLAEIGYDVTPNIRYLELVRSFIGPVEFASVIGSVADAKRSGDRGIADVGSYLGGALRNSFRQYVKYLQKGKA